MYMYIHIFVARADKAGIFRQAYLLFGLKPTEEKQ